MVAIPGQATLARRLDAVAQHGPGGRLLVFVVKRALFIPVSLFVIVTVAFSILYLLPGDPAVAIVGDNGTPADVERIRQSLGLEHSFWTRYGDYLNGVIHGDLGTSFFTQEKITTEIGRYLPNTLELIVFALLIAAVIGISLGSLAAYFRGRALDRVARVITTALQSTPDFFLAGVLIYTLFYLARVAPAPVGRMRIDSLNQSGFLVLGNLFHGNWYDLWDALRHMFLPGLALGAVYASYFAKTARTSMSRALWSDQVEFARACGLRESLVLRYAFATARTPILTYGAILFGVLVGGEAIVETIFSWQGIGQWALQGSFKLDLPVMQGFILVTGVMTLTIYLILDMLVYMLDPRVSYD